MEKDDCPERVGYAERHRHVDRLRPSFKAAVLGLAVAALALAYLFEAGPSSGASHDAFVRARPDLRERKWEGEAATLFRDPSDPKAVHVCTAKGCEEVGK